MILDAIFSASPTSTPERLAQTPETENTADVFGSLILETAPDETLPAEAALAGLIEPAIEAAEPEVALSEALPLASLDGQPQETPVSLEQNPYYVPAFVEAEDVAETQPLVTSQEELPLLEETEDGLDPQEDEVLDVLPLIVAPPVEYAEPKAEAKAEPLELNILAPAAKEKTPELALKEEAQADITPISQEKASASARFESQMAPSEAPESTDISQDLTSPFIEADLRNAEEPVSPIAAPEKKSMPAPSPLVRNVLDRMETLELSEGKTKVLLKPQGLGLLEIDLTRMVDGRMQLILRAENPMVLQALQQEGSALGQFMQESGFNLSGGQPQFGAYEPPAEAHGEEAEADAPAEEELPVLKSDEVNIIT